MLVDDEEPILYLVGRILKKAGHDVITASSGGECLDILKTEKPDLILLDVMMPGGLDGFETCATIKDDEENRSILVVMFTVKSSREHRLQSLEQCAADWHIAKSMDSKKLVEVVNWLLKSPPRGVEGK